MPETLLIREENAAAYVTLNRPAARNAMNQQMVEELLAYFTQLREKLHLRALVIGAAGTSFCAGGDLGDMQAEASMSAAEKAARMEAFDAMLHAINTAPQVTIARVQGAAMGGGLGLVCVADIAIAGESARFALPEVHLGLSPALISPYLIQRMGLTRARHLMLTGASFDAQAALSYELVQSTCADAELDQQVATCLAQVLRGGPQALAATKALLFEVAQRPPAESLPYRVALINRLRESEEAQQGIQAFFQKQAPPWAG